MDWTGGGESALPEVEEEGAGGEDDALRERETVRQEQSC